LTAAIFQTEKTMIDSKLVRQYHESGCIVVPGLLDTASCKQMKQVLADLVEASRQVERHNDVFDLEPTHSKSNPRVRRIKLPHLVDPVFNSFIRSETLLGVMRQLIGPSLRLRNSKLNLKVPHVGSPVEWHQDWAFYPHTNDDILAVGVMLDDTMIKNGALHVIPGSHKGPTYDHHDADGYFCGAIDVEANRIDVSSAVACEGAAGSCSFHHVRAIHGSAQNTSRLQRGLLLYEVTAADAFPLMGIPDYNDFTSRLLCGHETIEPRTTVCPIRMPLPPSRNQGSIYENQRTAHSYFPVTAEATVAP
jgi:phytanoyl-CoA hydroxylase